MEINPDDQVDFDMLLEEQFNEDHCFVEVINDDKEEMHEVRLLRLLEEYENEKNQNKAISIEMEAAIELLSMLRKSNASFQLYSKIVKWAEHFPPGAIHEKLPSRECVLKTLSARYYLDCLKPFKNPCVLPMTN